MSPETDRQYGRLVAFEGPDGVGKSAILEATVAELTDRGVDAVQIPFPGRDPGYLGALVYDLYHDLETVGLRDITPAALQALFVASHLDGLERTIRPAVQQHTVVLLDRFWWSMVAYAHRDGVAEDIVQRLVDLELTAWTQIDLSTVFLVMREDPIRRELSGSSWGRVVESYRELAAMTTLPVVEVINEGSVDKAVAIVVSSIEAMLLGD